MRESYCTKGTDKLSRSKLFIIQKALLLVLITLPSLAHAQIPTLNKTPDSVFRVEARMCPTDELPGIFIETNDGTAFVWRDSKTLITAFHVVEGCGEIHIYRPNSTVPLVAELSELSLPHRDIAVLTLSEKVDAYPLEFREVHPPTGFLLQMFGHAFGAGSLAAKQVTVASLFDEDWPALEDILNAQGQASVTQTHSRIELDTKIIQVNGEITDGLSGAPVFDFEGYVVGIASGSIGVGGDQSVNWAIGASHLNDIVMGSDIVNLATGPQLSFVENEPESDQGRPILVQCGLLDFSFEGNHSFSELFDQASNKDLLTQAVQMQGLSDAQLAGLMFDIWVNDRSGMQIAIPQGNTFQDNSSEPCKVPIGDDASLTIQTYIAPDTGEFQRLQHFATFSNWFATGVQMELTEDMTPDNTMAFNFARDTDRYFFTRNVFFRHDLDGGFGETTSNFALISNHARGRYYVGVAASRSDYETSSEINSACQQDFNGAICSEFREKLLPWSSAVVAAHISTMPIRSDGAP